MSSHQVALSCRDVEITYGDGGRALRGVDLNVAEGECVALVGESGSGKTTLARAVLGLLSARTRVDGSILVAGVQVVGASATTMRSLRGLLVGYVPQDPHAACDPLRSVRAHVAEAWHAHGRRPPRGAVERALEALGVRPGTLRAAPHPHQWSGGMLQRATIAAADAHEPPLLVADEPTSSLDADRAHDVLARLRAAARSLLLVSHDLALVAAHADRVAVCYAGRVVEEGPADQVTAAPRHPYTRALLAATPRPGDGLPAGLAGVPPSARAPDEGCAFAARCPDVEPGCIAAVPTLQGGVRCPVATR